MFDLRKSPPHIGKIRILTIPNYDTRNWIHLDAFYNDRTITEWQKYILSLRTPIQFTDCPQILFPVPPSPVYEEGTIPCPWFHRFIAADHVQTILDLNLRIRWICRKWIHRLRQKIMNKRTIGTTDFVSFDIIHPKHAVYVYDIPSRSRYCFHVDSIHQQICENLSYQSYGIAQPVPPRNPYTNIKWSTGQIMVLVDQIQRFFWECRHKFVNPQVIRLHNSTYNVKKMLQLHYRSLHIAAAYNFFKDMNNPDVLDIFDEVLIELLEELSLPKDGRVYQYVSNRSICKNLLKEWDEIITSIWIYQNHSFVVHPVYKSYIDIYTGAGKLYKNTLMWINTNIVPRQRRQVRPTRPNIVVEPIVDNHNNQLNQLNRLLLPYMIDHFLVAPAPPLPLSSSILVFPPTVNQASQTEESLQSEETKTIQHIV